MTTAQTPARPAANPEQLPTEKYLYLTLSDQKRARLPAFQAVEILTLERQHITPIPDVPAAILGIGNWRQQVLWLVDLPTLLDLTPIMAQVQQRQFLDVVVVRVQELRFGLVNLGVEGIGAATNPTPDDLLVDAGAIAAQLATGATTPVRATAAQSPRLVTDAGTGGF